MWETCKQGGEQGGNARAATCMATGFLSSPFSFWEKPLQIQQTLLVQADKEEINSERGN